MVPENAVRFLGHKTHSHPVPHLIHVVTGAADLVVDGAALRLEARENLWLAPEVPHSACYTPESVVLGPFLSPGTLPAGRLQALGVVPRLTHLAGLILGVSPHTPEQVEPFRLALDDVLLSMSPEYFPLRLPAHPVAREIARASTTSHRTLEELAAGRYTSVRHLQRLFREETGLSFSQWRARARLNVAIRRLRGGDSQLLAARIAGYASRASLLKALGRESGLPARLLAADPLAALEARERGAAGGPAGPPPCPPAAGEAVSR